MRRVRPESLGAGAPGGPRLLVIVGGDGERRPTGAGGHRIEGNSDLFKLLPDWLRFEQLTLGPGFLRQGGRLDLPRYDCVLNLITDPDLHPRTLAVQRKLLRGFQGRIINPAEAVLRSARDQVARRLAGIAGLKVPRVLRLRGPRPGAASAMAGRAGLEYPLIVRRSGTHGGRILGLADGPTALDRAAAGPGEFIVTEFVDFRSGDGLYRKYRTFFIGRQRLFRHLIGADQWNIHGRERFAFMARRPDLIDEELRILKRPEGRFPGPVDQVLAEVRERIGLDVFGLDFGIAADGRVVLFEANATMNFFPVVNAPPFAHIECVVQPALTAMLAMIGRSPPQAASAMPPPTTLEAAE